MTFGLAIISYCGWLRTNKLLETLKANDTKLPITVFEDLSPYPEVTVKYQKVCDKHGVPLSTAKEWGCGQGNSHRAMVEMEYDVVFLLADDVLATPHAIDNMVYFWENNQDIPLGGVLFPVWQSSEMVTSCQMRCPQEFYALDVENIPKNQSYNRPQALHCFHCSGFALDRKLYFDLGGFSQGHWANDEDIAWKIWIKTNKICCSINGQPLIHLGSQSQCNREYNDRMPRNQRDGVIKDWGIPYSEVTLLHQQAMRDKIAEYNEMLAKAKVYEK